MGPQRRGDSSMYAYVSQNWIDDTTIGAGTAADAQTNYSVPVSAVRLVVASGTITMTVNQAGHV